MKYIPRTTQITVLPFGEPIFSEKATLVSIEDQACGEYIKIKQQADPTKDTGQTVAFDADEWVAVKNVVEKMFQDIKNHHKP